MPPNPVVAAASRAAGAGLAAASGATAALRRGRPLHPQGVTFAAAVTTTGAGASGVPWLDEAGTSEVRARVSRAMGLPAHWPDIYGLALHIPLAADGSAVVADLLFASTGDSAVGRFALTPRRRFADGPLTTLLPVRAPAGPLLLRVVPARGTPLRDEGPGLSLPARMVLSYAVGTGPWVDVAELALGTRVEDEQDPRRHDPIRHELPGIAQYDVVRRLREPAYAAARAVPVRRRGH